MGLNDEMSSETIWTNEGERSFAYIRSISYNESVSNILRDVNKEFKSLKMQDHWYCGYLVISEHDWDLIKGDLGEEASNLEVHGGMTFFEGRYHDSAGKCSFVWRGAPCICIGWDYNHSGDGDQTLEDVIKDVRAVQQKLEDMITKGGPEYKIVT